MKRTTITFALLSAMLPTLPAKYCKADDEITMKNGKKIEASIAGIRNGSLVFGDTHEKNDNNKKKKAGATLALANVKQVVFDGARDSFSFALRDGTATTGLAIGIEKGTLSLASGESIKLTAIKQMSREDDVDQERLSLDQTQIGAQGFIFATLRIESADPTANRCIASYSPIAEGIRRDDLRKVAVLQGIDCTNLVTGAFVSVPQRLEVSATETLSNGQTVFVFQPVDETQTTILKANDPLLKVPHKPSLRVRDIRK